MNLLGVFYFISMNINYQLFLHCGCFLQNLGKNCIRTNMHTTVVLLATSKQSGIFFRLFVAFTKYLNFSMNYCLISGKKADTLKLQFSYRKNFTSRVSRSCVLRGFQTRLNQICSTITRLKVKSKSIRIYQNLSKPVGFIYVEDKNHPRRKTHIDQIFPRAFYSNCLFTYQAFFFQFL